MRALPVPAEALPQAPPGGMIPPGPPQIFMLHLKSVPVAGWMNGVDFFNGFALMGNAGQPCIKTWEHGRRGRGGGEKFADVPAFKKRLLLCPAHPLKNHLL